MRKLWKLMKRSELNSFLLTFFVMLNFGQKVSLESFQLLVVVYFRTENFCLSKNRAISRDWNPYSKCKNQKKISQTVLNIILKLFNILAKFPFTTDKMLLDI